MKKEWDFWWTMAWSSQQQEIYQVSVLSIPVSSLHILSLAHNKLASSIYYEVAPYVWGHQLRNCNHRIRDGTHSLIDVSMGRYFPLLTKFHIIWTIKCFNIWVYLNHFFSRVCRTYPALKSIITFFLEELFILNSITL